MTDWNPVLRPDRHDAAWGEFCEALWAAICMIGCQCDHQLAAPLLAERGFDAEASLALYEERGGYCDCEILFNVDHAALEEELAGGRSTA